MVEGELGQSSDMVTRRRLADKLSMFHASPTLGLKAVATQRRARQLPVYDFGLGETNGKPDPAICGAGSDAFHTGQTMYADPAGLPELRRATLRWLNLDTDYSTDNAVICSGAKQGLFNILLSICNPGDRILLDAAPWVSYQPMARAVSVEPIVVAPRVARPRSLKIRPADLAAAIDRHPDAKLFIFNNPVNPTGELYDQDEVDALVRTCAERRLYVVLDRLYWRILYDNIPYPAPHLTDATRDWVIQIDGVSKCFRRTGGLRIGWSVAPDDVARAMIALQSHYTSGPAVPTQLAALAAIDRPYDSELRVDLQRKRDLLTRHAAAIPHIDVWPTAATFFSFWDVRPALGHTAPNGATIDSSDQLAAYLLQDAGVLTISGGAFMQDGYLRLSFATDDQQIVDGMRAAQAALAALRPSPAPHMAVAAG